MYDKYQTFSYAMIFHLSNVASDVLQKQAPSIRRLKEHLSDAEIMKFNSETFVVGSKVQIYIIQNMKFTKEATPI